MIKLGQRLRHARMSYGYSIDDVVKATKIRYSFIQAIERGDYSKLPSPTYAQGFVKNYASYLNLPVKEVMALFRREFDERDMLKVLPTGMTDTLLPFSFRIHHKALLVVFIFIVVLAFALYQFRYAFINPPLNIVSPKQNYVFSTSEIRIVGQTDPDASVAVNGASVVVNKNGKFEKIINAFTGKVKIIVTAKHRFGKETTREFEVTVEE